MTNYEETLDQINDTGLQSIDEVGIQPESSYLGLLAGNQPSSNSFSEPQLDSATVEAFAEDTTTSPELLSTTNLIELETAVSSLGNEEDILGNWDTLFPQDAIDELLNPNNVSLASTPATIPTDGPIFKGQNAAIADSNATLIFDQDLNNPIFYWQSNDSVLGEINATIDTTPGMGTNWKYNPIQNCLFFQGTADGAIINGAIVANRGMVTAIKNGRAVSYLFELESLNSYTDHRELLQRETDLYIPGRSSADSVLDYSFTRNYDYYIDNTEESLGYNWKHEYFQRLEFQIDGSIIYDEGLERRDRFYLNEIGDAYVSPPEIFMTLTENNDGTYDLRDADGVVRKFDSEGKLIEISDRNENFVTLQYNAEDQMIRFVDTLGRNIDYNYISGGVNDGKLDNITDFDGRTVDFTYDSNGDLIEVTSPTVTGTPNGNDFVDGKTTRYSYSSGFSEDRLNHNLLTVTLPNEVANGGEAVLTVEYGTELGTVEFDRVLSKTYGGTNSSGVEAGGTYTYEYELLTETGDSTDPNEAVLRTTRTDRNGNVAEYTYNTFGYYLSIKEFTKGLRNGEPEFFETTFEYNADGLVVSQTDSEGNITEYNYDETNPSRFANANLLSIVMTPDADRGGDQTEIQTLNIYEPIYQLLSLSVDPRGLDTNFIPPIAEPDGRSQQERYSTRYFYDYQEADASIILPLLAEELGTTEADVQAQLTAAGIQLGLGDLNQDGVIATSIAGNLIRIEAPSPVLLAGSNQAIIEGDQLQDVVTLYRYNQFGQVTSMVISEKLNK